MSTLKLRAGHELIHERVKDVKAINAKPDNACSIIMLVDFAIH